MSHETAARFQVDLRGMIDLLSQHLYSSPSVFVRELLQNGVDAIVARQAHEAGFRGKIELELIRPAEGAPTLVIQDNGIGLTETEIEQFLATIGGSSKRGAELNRPTDFIGQFGIGLLACFLVADEIVVVTRSAKNEHAAGIEWRGRVDGTYATRTLAESPSAGTRVYLRAKPSAAHLFDAKALQQLIRHYGEFLPIPIQFAAEGRTDTIHREFPWTPAGRFQSREELLAAGTQIFDTEFLDVIPLQSTAARAFGAAYVLPMSVPASARQSHRVYLKHMLLSDRAEGLLPDWAFFVRCLINTDGLRPTASREAFYEDELLEEAREDLGQALKTYLKTLERDDPARLQRLIAVHHLAIKAMCASDDECLALFADSIPFETTLGTMTLGEFRRQHPLIRYVGSQDQFRQLAPVATAEAIPLINAGYVYDLEILERFAQLRRDVRIEPFDADQLSDRFEALTLEEREASHKLARLADVVLQEFRCEAEMAKFRPAELPALFIAGPNAELMRSLEQSREVSDSLLSSILGNIGETVQDSYARLQLNYSNPLIQRIAGMDDPQGQRRCVEMLYIQALLMGHVPLRTKETKLLNRGLLGLIDWALSRKAENGDE